MRRRACPCSFRPVPTRRQNVAESDPQHDLQTELGFGYTIERELGRGGTATVYLALDAKHQRSVALKVLHSDLAASLGPDRFRREITFAAKLQHPHILTVLDSGETQSGRLWFTMPYVEGESLRHRLEHHRQLRDRRGAPHRARDRARARLRASARRHPSRREAREHSARRRSGHARRLRHRAGRVRTGPPTPSRHSRMREPQSGRPSTCRPSSRWPIR